MSVDPRERTLAELDCFHCFYRFRQAEPACGAARYEAWLEYRKAVLRRDGHRCRLCSRVRDAEHLDVQPIHPRPRGDREMEPDNLACVCVFCQQSNGVIRPRRHGVLA